MRWILHGFDRRTYRQHGHLPLPIGTLDIDGNNNSLGVYVNQTYAQYQGGMFIDAIIASGTPDAVTNTGGTNLVNRKYKDIVQDFVDGYLNCMYRMNPGGGWRYSCGEFPDNSACQSGRDRPHSGRA